MFMFMFMFILSGKILSRGTGRDKTKNDLPHDVMLLAFGQLVS
jgi:hypothetical protein